MGLLYGLQLQISKTVKNGEKSEFSGEDALMSLMMESAAKESAANNGPLIIKLPIEQELEVDRKQLVALERKNGVNPMDVDQIIEHSIARP